MNLELEENIIGALLSKPDLMKNTVIPDNCFLDKTNRFIFRLLKKQFDDDGTIELCGLATNYKKYFTEEYPVNDILNKLVAIMESTVPITSNYDYYQKSLFSHYVENQMLNAIKQFNESKITKDELFNLIHKYESLGIDTQDHHYSSKEIFSLINSQNKIIKFRFNKLSAVANIQEHDFVIIAARTGIGKSGFCLNLLEDISDRYNCIYFNMEIAEKQLYQRLVSINSKIPMTEMDNIKTKYQQDSIFKSCQNIFNKKIKVFNQAQTVSNIRRIIINESKLEHTVVFIDHVGLIVSQKNSSIYENITAITKELRQISLNYNCTIILVSQLNRSADDESVPKLSELKDSGELEQSATTVIMLHDEHYGNNISKSEIELSFFVAKNRNGSLGKTKYLYNKLNQRFDELEEKR
jgi:replicative DNA helicase